MTKARIRAAIMRERAAAQCLVTALYAARIGYFDHSAFWLYYTERNLDAAAGHLGVLPLFHG